MTLGEKLKEARLAAGLSQRQLCGEKITRNMLSQIENGTARPSMDTLQYLADRLEKPVGYFLEENGKLAQCRMAYENRDWASVVELAGEEVGEAALMKACAQLELAEQMLADGRELYALRLLEEWRGIPGYTECLERKRLLLLGRLRPEAVELLPSMDEELLLRALWALQNRAAARAAELLDAAEDQAAPQWKLLRGRAEYLRQAYAKAAEYLTGVEKEFPQETVQMLEHCYRELGDYKMAYHYACLQRENERGAGK